MNGVQRRLLGPDDAADYQHPRLRGLQEAPEAFGSTYAEDVALPLVPATDAGPPTV